MEVDEGEFVFYTKKLVSVLGIVKRSGGYCEDSRDIFDDDYDQESIYVGAQTENICKRKKKNVSKNVDTGKLQPSNISTKKKEVSAFCCCKQHC